MVQVLLVILFGLFSSQPCLSQSPPPPLFPAIISFGDSALDVGNNNHRHTYFKANYFPYGRDFTTHQPTGRFSNGKLVIDFTAETLGLKTSEAYLSSEIQSDNKNHLSGANFASAGAGYDDKTSILNHAIPLSQQLKMFREYKAKLKTIVGTRNSSLIIKEALYLVSGGTADFLQNYYNPKLNQTLNPQQYTSLLVKSSSSFVKELYKLGARRIGVTSLAPLGCMPETKTIFNLHGKKCVKAVNKHAQQFNLKLNTTSLTLTKQLPGLKLVVFNIYSTFYNLIKAPSTYGFVEVRRGCCGSGKRVLCDRSGEGGGTCLDARKYLFWDSVHPSEAANQVLADAMLGQGFAFIG